MANLEESDREIVAMLLDTKAVDFEAIGRTIGAHGSKFIGEATAGSVSAAATCGSTNGPGRIWNSSD